jgi:indolepyruvate ferredoxin oxidoreductase, alpha subunit
VVLAADTDHPRAAMLASGNEAIAAAALAAGVALGTGYPGTPSTEILEHLSALGGPAQWAPNEKVALEVALGAAFAGARALVTMKHVGLNVAADPLFTAAYTGVTGGLVVVSADDPGMASSQNEQDNRRYAVAAGLPMLEPSDSQEAYEFTLAAFDVSERWGIPVLLRTTTRVSHSKSVLCPGPPPPSLAAPPHPAFVRDIRGRVMIPAYARPAHRRLRAKLGEIATWAESCALNSWIDARPDDALAGARTSSGDREPASAGVPASPPASAGEPRPPLGIVSSGVAHLHAREAAPAAAHLKLGITHPLPLGLVRSFASSVERCLVVEEGDPYLVEQLRTAGIGVDDKPAVYRFGELNVGRVRRLVSGDTSPEAIDPPGKPPELCNGCPHGTVFGVLREMDCIVAGDIGCYTLGVLPPYEALDTCVDMGAAIGVGLGLRHVLPDAEARRVVSVIGDSTFVHSGITGIVEMVYNPPPTGHVVLILDNGTTAMTGRQEHPGTGRTLDHRGTGRVSFEDLVRALGVRNVLVLDPMADVDGFRAALAAALASGEPGVIIARRPCILAVGDIRAYERAIAERAIAPSACVTAGEGDD